MDESAFAHQLLDVCLGLRRGERVWINSWDHALGIASSLAWECRKRNCDVFTTIQQEELWLHSILRAPIELLDRMSDQTVAALKKTDVYIYTLGPSRPIPWHKIPKERRRLGTRWFLENNNLVKSWKRVARKNRIRMLGVEATLATPETAKALGLDYQSWRKVMFDGCMADYRKIAKHARRLAKIAGREGEVRVRTAKGTDFTFRLDRRRVDQGNGLADERTVRGGRPVFLPAGAVEASASEDSAQGTIVFDAPILSLVREGRIEMLKLEVKNGRIQKYSATKNAPGFGRWMKGGSGDIDRFGFFGFGLNPKLRHGFTQDDKVLGGMTIGFGDNADKGGRNRADGRGFWASITKASVSINDVQVMKQGWLLV